ncbi:TPA: hypothetical protein GDO54_018571 [Pyxicephalus adspersus]|uniref:Uncharacterized protein n=1 Tax=Pyxicephalus adspersus TaxID=30357 RepID=A0AAV2ZNT6_PYXAD|nr:TPA: hypothetical protein GDO54_018571 [Pyxicephalus adspersus]
MQVMGGEQSRVLLVSSPPPLSIEQKGAACTAFVRSSVTGNDYERSLNGKWKSNKWKKLYQSTTPTSSFYQALTN